LALSVLESQLDLSRSRDVSSHVTIRFTIDHFPWWSVPTESLSRAAFEILDSERIWIASSTSQQGSVT